MLDPGTMSILKGLLGGAGAPSILSPFAQIAQTAIPGAKLDKQEEKGFTQLFGEHMGEKKDKAMGQFDQKKSRLMSLFKLFAGGGA